MGFIPKTPQQCDLYHEALEQWHSLFILSGKFTELIPQNNLLTDHTEQEGMYKSIQTKAKKKSWYGYEKVYIGAGEMAQRLRALPTLPNVLSSIPGNHMVAHNHL